MTIDVKEAEARFEELITQVEAGEEIVICRDGAPVAKLAAFDPEARRAAIEKVIEDVRAFGARAKPVTAEELIACKNEGRRY
jgi:prevent-host-death family protein